MMEDMTNNAQADAAATDLQEALLIASDGAHNVPVETLREAMSLLMHGTDYGEFFQGFHRYFASPVSEMTFLVDQGIDSDTFIGALNERYEGKALRFPLIHPNGTWVTQIVDPGRGSTVRVKQVDGKVVFCDEQ